VFDFLANITIKHKEKQGSFDNASYPRLNIEALMYT